MPIDKKASSFYDSYHEKSLGNDELDPVRLKTREIFMVWLKKLNAPQGAAFLDLSCGLGHFLEAARDSDPSLKLHGLDHSAFAVKAAQKRVPSARVIRGDAMKLPYKSASFDVVSCVGSLEHYPDSEKGLAEIARVLKPGGKAFVYVPNLFFVGYIYFAWKSGETPHEAGQNEYERFETRQGWEQMIARNGLIVDSVAKHNEMYATDRVPALVKTAYAWFVEPLVPFNLSYCFGYFLHKAKR